MSRNLLQFLDLLLLFLGCMVIAVALSPQHGGEIGIIAPGWQYVTLVSEPTPRLEIVSTSSPECTAFAWLENGGQCTLMISAKWPLAQTPKAADRFTVDVKGPVPAGLKGKWYSGTQTEGQPFTFGEDGNSPQVPDVVLRTAAP